MRGSGHLTDVGRPQGISSLGNRLNTHSQTSVGLRIMAGRQIGIGAGSNHVSIVRSSREQGSVWSASDPKVLGLTFRETSKTPRIESTGAFATLKETSRKGS